MLECMGLDGLKKNAQRLVQMVSLIVPFAGPADAREKGPDIPGDTKSLAGPGMRRLGAVAWDDVVQEANREIAYEKVYALNSVAAYATARSEYARANSERFEGISDKTDIKTLFKEPDLNPDDTEKVKRRVRFEDAVPLLEMVVEMIDEINKMDKERAKQGSSQEPREEAMQLMRIMVAKWQEFKELVRDDKELERMIFFRAMQLQREKKAAPVENTSEQGSNVL